MAVNIADLKVIELLAESRKIVLNEAGVNVVRVFEVDYTDAYLLNHVNPAPLDPEEILLLIWDPNSGNTTPLQIGDVHPIFNNPNTFCSYISEIRPEQVDRTVKVIVQYVPYEVDARADINGEIWEFNWSGQQQHITSTSLGQLHYPTWADTGWVIGVDGEEVQGCDVYRPTGTLKVSKKLTSYPNDSTMRDYMDAVACVNSASMAHGIIQAGEALFTGVNVVPVRRQVFLLELNFLISRQMPAVTVTLMDGDTVGPLTIGPWQYVWFRHQGKMADKEGGGKARQNGIESVHVATVYESKNFTNIFALLGPTY